MKRLILALAVAAAVLFGGIWNAAYATPSTHIWSPSTDVQAYKTFHLTADTYVPVRQDEEIGAGERFGPVTNLGLTVGVLPFEKVNLEVGFDHIAGYGDYDAYPIFYNAKLGIPEGKLGDMFPAIAVGGYAFGTNSETTSLNRTDYNIYYGKVAKTLGKFGRLSAGYYAGNDELLLDEVGEADETGYMVAWERTMSEISDNLWFAVDYMSGENSFGVLSYGFSWKFAPNTSVIFGYVDQNNDELAYVEDTFTVQVDIDFNPFEKK